MPSRPLVCSASPTCTSALPDMKRNSMPPPGAPLTAPPKAALRCWVRVLITGIAASLSASSVTSAVSG